MLKKAVLIYSGGMDSFTLLNDLVGQGYDVHALTFNYSQRHVKEIGYATRVCHELQLAHKVIQMEDIGRQLMQGSALTGGYEVPEGHYEEESMKTTVVPNRNMIMISLAIAYAISIECDAIFIGAHAGDHVIYPDCRPEFIDAMSVVSQTANYLAVEVFAPYIDLSKGKIAMIGKGLGLNYGDAWTCYKGNYLACGKCGACQERIEAMDEAGIDDPMEYAI